MARNFISSTSRSWSPRVHVSAHVVLTTMVIWQIMPTPVAAVDFNNLEALKVYIDNKGWYEGCSRGGGCSGDSIEYWGVSKVTDFTCLFAFKKGQDTECSTTYSRNGDGWWNENELSYVGCVASGKDRSLNSWDTSRVTDMYCAFHSAKYFNWEIDQWDVSKVKSLKKSKCGFCLFQFCLHLLTEQPTNLVWCPCATPISLSPHPKT